MNATVTVPAEGVTLADLYNADRRTTSDWVRLVAASEPIPHPLTGIDYADGSIQDTTAGHVRCVGCRIGRPCRQSRERWPA